MDQCLSDAAHNKVTRRTSGMVLFITVWYCSNTATVLHFFPGHAGHAVSPHRALLALLRCPEHLSFGTSDVDPRRHRGTRVDGHLVGQDGLPLGSCHVVWYSCHGAARAQVDLRQFSYRWIPHRRRSGCDPRVYICSLRLPECPRRYLVLGGT